MFLKKNRIYKSCEKYVLFKAISNISQWIACGIALMVSTWIFKIIRLITILEDVKSFFDKWTHLMCSCI